MSYWTNPPIYRQKCAAGLHGEWYTHSGHSATCPWCENRRLRDEIERLSEVPWWRRGIRRAIAVALGRS